MIGFLRSFLSATHLSDSLLIRHFHTDQVEAYQGDQAFRTSMEHILKLRPFIAPNCQFNPIKNDFTSNYTLCRKR